MAPDDREETPIGEYPRVTDEPASHSIVQVVAAVTDQSVTELEPLARVIDVDALEALLSETLG